MRPPVKCQILFPMNNDIRISRDLQVGTGFVPARYLLPGEDEYRIRDEQLLAAGKDPRVYRGLKPFELETLIRNNNTCSNWALIQVADPFTPELVHNTFFSGLVRISRLEQVSLEHHDLHLFAGISNSQVIACDIGENCVINNCSYIAHYIIGDNCILIDNAEIHVSNHSKFGNGAVIEGEEEELRITIDVMNEGGGRWIYPFDGITCADAYLWARYRDDGKLMREFCRMTDTMFDARRGRYGTIGPGSVLKSNGVIKDVAIGDSAYIKGSNKLKNLTIKSREDARTQIGEGVELVNGIIGYGCKIFYGCKAVRFVMCDNSSLKYGARLIHSVLGENSTVSCCEILNNLIFPAHEQHHNTSFLIASLVRGQSNIAAGATIGSNHNSRAPDGEIEAGRGFWPGLCTSVKHSSRFASFCLLAKGDYRFELNIPFPFCLVDNDYKRDRLVLVPAYWWSSNMYALMRNEAKFLARDQRTDKALRLEYSPFAPDTAEEIISAMALLEEMTGKAFEAYDKAGAAGPAMEEIRALARKTGASSGKGKAEKRGAGRAVGRAILESGIAPPFEVKAENIENSSRECVIVKPCRAWRAYREMLLWFAGRETAKFALGLPEGELSWKGLEAAITRGGDCAAGSAWENLGGLLVSQPRLDAILSLAGEGAYPTWREFHEEYGKFSALYEGDKARYAWAVLGLLYPRSSATSPAAGRPGAPSREDYIAALGSLESLSRTVEREMLSSRSKDWDNMFRKATYRSKAEMTAVLGRPEESPFLIKAKKEMETLRLDLRRISDALKEG